MAICKEVENSIKAHQYVYDSIAYVLSPENKHGDEKCFRATCLNCENAGIDSLAQQFFETRRAYNKDKEILAHHYVQSFSPNENITPELAHQIGVELAEKIAPGFQVIVSTHIDKDHIHNHLIINSVSMETGMKWKGNGDTLTKSVRPESDRICKSYGLANIDNLSGLRGIDQSTQKLAEQGNSWKVELCKALDEAIKTCNTKNEFIDFMKCKHFDITHYGDKDITFQKIGETKKIRASYLASQFGDYYTKENLEKLMGFYRLPKKSEQPQPIKKSKLQTSSFVSEFEKYEKNYFSKNPPPAKISETRFLQQIIRNSSRPLLMLLLIIMRLLIRQRKCLDKKYSVFHRYCKRQKKYRVYKPSFKEQIAKAEKMQMTAGNIPYKNLVSAQGENYRIKISLSSVPKLYAYPFFFSARLYKDYALVTIKEKNKLLLQKALEVENIQVLENHNKHYSSKAEYNDLKHRAKLLGVKIEFLNITSEQFEKLKSEKDRFVSSSVDGRIRLAFLPQNKDYILHSLYPDKYKNNNNLFSVSRNSRVNTKLKSEALLGGQKMRYRTLTKEQVEKLYSATENEELFAVFNKNAKGHSLGDNYNIAFKESDNEKIENALKNQDKTKRKI